MNYDRHHEQWLMLLILWLLLFFFYQLELIIVCIKKMFASTEQRVHEQGSTTTSKLKSTIKLNKIELNMFSIDIEQFCVCAFFNLPVTNKQSMNVDYA
jgi:hypothetical protein